MKKLSFVLANYEIVYNITTFKIEILKNRTCEDVSATPRLRGRGIG